jgi:hypothetical protein
LTPCESFKLDSFENRFKLVPLWLLRLRWFYYSVLTPCESFKLDSFEKRFVLLPLWLLRLRWFNHSVFSPRESFKLYFFENTFKQPTKNLVSAKIRRVSKLVAIQQIPKKLVNLGC